MADNFDQLGFTEAKAAPTGDFKSLGFAPAATPDRGIVGEIQQAGGILPFLRAIPLGAQREITRLTGAPQAGQFALGGLAGQALVPAKPQIPAGAERAARAGGTLADIAGFTGVEELGAPILGALGLGGAGAGLGARIGKRLISGFPAGAAVSPDNRIIGGILGSLLSAGGEAAPSIVKAAPKILKGIKGIVRPNIIAKGIAENLPKTKSAESVLNELGGGRSLNENAQNIAAKIKKAGTAKLTESGKRFEDINKRAGVNSMYPEGKPVSKDSYKALEKWKRPPMMHYTDTLKDAHEDFMDIPTFDKAHKLQSTLGSIANRTLKNPASNMQQIDVAGRFVMAQDRLLNDMHSHLNKIDPSKQLSTEYDAARNLHALDVVPYKDSKPIREIVKGKVQNPRNLTTIFKNPESNTLKVVKDIGSEAKDQIVYNELRATTGKNPTAQKVLNAFSGLEKKGLGSYISPKLKQQMEGLKQTAAQEEFSKQIGAKPTSEKVLKAADKLENKDLMQNLSPSVQDQINALRTRTVRAKWIKRGVGIAGLGLLAKELLPAHIRREIF